MSSPRVPVQTYQENRRTIPPVALEQHRGKWVAFSPDGTRIVASAKRLTVLDKKLRALGQDPQDVVYEYLGTKDIVLGGAELL